MVSVSYLQILPMTDPAGAGRNMLTLIGGIYIHIYIDGIHGTPQKKQHHGFVMGYFLFVVHFKPKDEVWKCLEDDFPRS